MTETKNGIRRSRFVPLRDIPTFIGGFGTLLTILRWTEWYNAAQVIGIRDIPMITFQEGIVLGLYSALLVAVQIWLVCDRTFKMNMGVEWTFFGCLFSLLLPIILISRFRSSIIFDAGFTVFLVFHGIIVSVSSYLYRRVADFQASTSCDRGKSNYEEYLKLEHKEKSDLIRDMIWLIASINVVLMFHQTQMVWDALWSHAGGGKTLLIWRTMLVYLLYVLWIDFAYIGGVIRALFIYRKIIKLEVLARD